MERHGPHRRGRIGSIDVSGFSSDWLALREPADNAARDAGLLARFRAALPADPRLIDLGAGTGSTARALAIPGARWTLVDNDPALLAEAANRMPGASAREADLVADLESVLETDADAITASALFDLASEDWTARFARAAGGRIVYAALTYDGFETWEPPHADDEAVTAAFNRHQQTDKGFGLACGPTGAAVLARALEAEGYAVTMAPSPWRLARADHGPMMDMLADGVAAAATEAGTDAAAWLAARKTARSARIGHLDLLALR